MVKVNKGNNMNDNPQTNARKLDHDALVSLILPSRIGQMMLGIGFDHPKTGVPL